MFSLFFTIFHCIILEKGEITSSKRISTSKCDICNSNFFGNFLEDLFGGFFWRIFLEEVFIGTFLEEFFGGIFLEKLFWIKNFGGFLEDFLGGFFWEDFLGGYFGRNSLFTLVKLFEYGRS